MQPSSFANMTESMFIITPTADVFGPNRASTSYKTSHASIIQREWLPCANYYRLLTFYRAVLIESIGVDAQVVAFANDFLLKKSNHRDRTDTQSIITWSHDYIISFYNGKLFFPRLVTSELPDSDVWYRYSIFDSRFTYSDSSGLVIMFSYRNSAVFDDTFGELDRHFFTDNFLTVYQVHAPLLRYNQSSSGVKISSRKYVGQWLSSDNGTERLQSMITPPSIPRSIAATIFR